jgi:parallel beta-helix repeat protein
MATTTDFPSGGGGGKKAAHVVIGSTGAGYTASDVDYLCDGANDSAQFDAALAAIPTAGGEIKILDGTYTLTKPWAIERSNINITGSGAGNTILRMTGTRNTTTTAAAAKSNNAVIYLSGSNCVIEGLTLANGTTETAGMSYGVYIDSGSNNTVTGNTISNSTNSGACYGLYINNSTNCTVTGNMIRNSSSGTSNCYGVYITSGPSNTVTGNTIANKRTSGQSTTNTFALYISATVPNYTMFTNNNLSGVTRATNPGSAYTTNGTAAATLPGSATTIAAFGTGGACGFNVA